MTNTLTPREIIAWFRERADEYTRIADTLEKTFTATPPMGGAAAARETANNVTPEMVRRHLAGRAGRIGPIADALNMGRQELRDLVTDPANGFTIDDKGWFRERNVSDIIDEDMNNDR